MAAQLVTIYWRDIPAQVTAQQGRNREKALLDARFQHAIDRAAMVAGMDDTDSYVAQWRREAVECLADLAPAVAVEAARFRGQLRLLVDQRRTTRNRQRRLGLPPL